MLVKDSHWPIRHAIQRAYVQANLLGDGAKTGIEVTIEIRDPSDDAFTVGILGTCHADEGWFDCEEVYSCFEQDKTETCRDALGSLLPTNVDIFQKELIHIDPEQVGLGKPPGKQTVREQAEYIADALSVILGSHNGSGPCPSEEWELLAHVIKGEVTVSVQLEVNSVGYRISIHTTKHEGAKVLHTPDEAENFHVQ